MKNALLFGIAVATVVLSAFVLYRAFGPSSVGAAEPTPVISTETPDAPADFRQAQARHWRACMMQH